MTALDRYDRLEALGQWHNNLDGLGQEVVVKFGEASLVILSLDDDPLAHWSLSAIRLLRSKADHSIYAVDGDSSAQLTIVDRPMRDALATVVARLDAGGQLHDRPQSRTRFFAGMALFCSLGMLILMSPALMRDLAHRLISPQRSAVLSNEMLPLIEDRTGPACRSARANAALTKLALRIEPQMTGRIHVLDLGDAPLLALPGGDVVLNAGIVERAKMPDEVAGWIALGLAGSKNSPALRGLFDKGGTYDGIKFILSGDLPEQAMNRSINRLLINPKVISPKIEAEVANMLTRARINSAPLITGIRREGLSTSLTPWQNTVPPETLLNDNEWVALQSICDG